MQARGDFVTRRIEEGARLSLLLRAAWQEYERDYARYFAKAIVYHALVALVPLILLLLSLTGLLLRFSGPAASVEEYVLQAIESNIGAPFRLTIETLLKRLQEGSLVATVVGLAGLVLGAASLVRHLRMTFRGIWKYAPPLASGGPREIVRTAVTEQLAAFAIVVAGGALLLGAFALIVATQWLEGLVGGLPLLGHAPGWLIAMPGPLVIVPLTFAVLFKLLPPVRLRWRDVWVASVLCAAAWMTGAEIFTLYGASLGGSFGAYGAVGGLLLFMWWLGLASQMLFYGAELCKVTAGSRTGGGVREMWADPGSRSPGPGPRR